MIRNELFKIILLLLLSDKLTEEESLPASLLKEKENIFLDVLELTYKYI